MSLTGFLSYSRVNWQQSPSKSTPWNATNLNIMDAGIKNNNDMISNLRDEVTQLNSNINNANLNINIDYNKDIFTIKEYFRYSIVNNICIIDIGGIVSNKIGLSLTISSKLPRAKTRGLCILSDGSSLITLAFNKINTTELYIHTNKEELVNKALYGQLIYFI